MEKEALQQQPLPDSWTVSTVKPLIIAGPCSAESPEQLRCVAQELKRNSSVSYMRAGVWKPRTDPNSFQGYGAEALEWLRSVKQEIGMPFATEVGCSQHVLEALKYGVDLVWIGARTVANPFAMQEIADALKGVDIPVMVKNPLNPDIELWDGAICRLLNAGIRKVGAIHRGFSLIKKSVFRNPPLWEIPLQLKQRYPNIPIICDSSHITGSRNLVPLVAQRAKDLNFDGFMVEVHPYPDIALSDPAQQLTPQQFDNLLEMLLNNNTPGCSNSLDMLDELRAEIDVMDDLLVWILSGRMELAGKIAGIKKMKNLQILQAERWNQIQERLLAKTSESGLRPQFISSLYHTIHKESLSIQSSLMKDKGKNINHSH